MSEDNNIFPKEVLSKEQKAFYDSLLGNSKSVLYAKDWLKHREDTLAYWKRQREHGMNVVWYKPEEMEQKLKNWKPRNSKPWLVKRNIKRSQRKKHEHKRKKNHKK